MLTSSKLNRPNIAESDQLNIAKVFASLEIEKNYKDNKGINPFKTLFIAISCVKDYYKSNNAQYIAYLLSLTVQKEKTILHLYANNEGDIYNGLGMRFWYLKILLQDACNTGYGPYIVNLQDAYGKTALHYACESFFLIDNPKEPELLSKMVMDQTAIIALLLAYGADPTIKDNNHKRPFDYLQEALNKIDTLTLAKLDANAFTFQALTNAYNHEIDYERRDLHRVDIINGLKKVGRDKEGIVIPEHPHFELLEPGNVYKQFAEAEHPENITRWQDKVKEVVVPQILSIPSSSENNSCRVGCILF